jgi:hypothetical protein
MNFDQLKKDPAFKNWLLHEFIGTEGNGEKGSGLAN